MAKKSVGFNAQEFAALAGELLMDITRAPNIKKYTPHEKQYHFHSSPKKRKLYIGGNRSGKTTGGVCEAIWRATCTHPYRPELNAIGPSRGRVVGVDFVNGIDKILIPQYKQWVYPSALRGGSWETAWDKFTKTLNFANESTIEFMSYDQDLDKFAGTSRHWIHFDEEPPRPIWLECMARLIDTEGEYWITMTPVEGMTWIYDDLYEGNVNNADGNVEVIEINTLENPFLSESAIKEFAESIDAEDVETRIGGGFVRQGGRIYKNFEPTPGAGQVLKYPIDDPKELFDSKEWLWIMALDHGLNNPTAVLWIAVDTNGFGVVFDEWYAKDMTIDQHAKKIKEKIRKHGRHPDLLVADPSIQNRNPVTGTSVQQEYITYGLPFTLGNNDVKAGLVRTRKYFNKNKYVSTRYPKFYKMLLDSQLEKLTEEGKPTDGYVPEFYRLMVSPACSNLIWELKRYRWKTYANKKLQYENNPYDEPHKKDDHACDALRYAIMTRPDLTAQSALNNEDNVRDIMEKLNKRMGIIDMNDRVADPNDFIENIPEGWDPLRSPLPSGDGWDYDEHMGGLF